MAQVVPPLFQSVAIRVMHRRIATSPHRASGHPSLLRTHVVYTYLLVRAPPLARCAPYQHTTLTR
eukprot:8249744-Pyramimonas_sp.AAC.1